MDLSNIAGMGAPVPPAAGPAAMVGQHPHMDYAQLPEQSMHELATWSTAGGSGAPPKPVALTVKGADDLLHWGEPFSLTRKYGYFETINGQAANAPMRLEVKYDDGATKALQPTDLTYTLETPDGGTEPLTLGQELQQAWGGSRQLTASYTDSGTVSTQLAVMIGEPVTDSMKLRFKIGVEIPEMARKDVIPLLEADRLVSKASETFNPDLLFKVEESLLTIDPVANCFDDSTGKLKPGWLVKDHTTDAKHLLRWRTNTTIGPYLVDGDQTSPSYYITEAISDPDYAWCGTERGDYGFRSGEFAGWSNLEYGLVEEATTTTYRKHYRDGQYHSCVRLKGFKTPSGDLAEQPEEATGVKISNSGDNEGYRSYQFAYCQSLTTPLIEHSMDSLANSYSFRAGQYWSCTSLTEAADEDPIPKTVVGFGYRAYQYDGCTSLTVSKPEHTFSMDGTVDADTATKTTFRASQYAGCTALKPSGVEKMIEKLTGASGAGMTRDNKYKGTGVTDETPFYYQDAGTGEPTPAHQRDTYSPSAGSYVHQYTMYGGHATTAYKITAETTSEWKTTYQAGETLDLTGLTVTVYRNDGRIVSYNKNSFDGTFRFSPQAGDALNVGDDSVTIRYQAYTTDTEVSTTVPVAVVPASEPQA